MRGKEKNDNRIVSQYFSRVNEIVIFCALFVLYMWLFIHCGRGIRRLKRKYKKFGP